MSKTKPNGALGGVRLPGRAPGVQVGSGADEPDDPLPLQLLVVGELPLGLGEGDLVGAEVDVAVLAVVLARDHGGEDEPDLARPQIREPDRPAARPFSVIPSSRSMRRVSCAVSARSRFHITAFMARSR